MFRVPAISRASLQDAYRGVGAYHCAKAWERVPQMASISLDPVGIVGCLCARGRTGLFGIEMPLNRVLPTGPSTEAKSRYAEDWPCRRCRSYLPPNPE